MQLVINHLTRMTAPRICVAGIEVDEFTHVRPVTPQTDLLTRSLLDVEGGPLAIGAVVGIGSPTPEPSPPETEDHWVSTSSLTRMGMLDANEYLDLLERVAEPDLETAFGEDLERRDWKYTVDLGRGKRSLAVVRARRQPRLEVSDKYDRETLTLRFSDPERPAFLTVTDVRFFEPDHQTINRKYVNDVNARLVRGVGTYVMFGLTRPFQGSAASEVHWLQVNGLCLEDRPLQ